MRFKAVTPFLLIFAVAVYAAERPRAFITESGSLHVTGEGSAGSTKAALYATGGLTPQSIEVMKTFTRLCPQVVVTANREKADYVVRLDHEGLNPTTPFVHGNKVAVFNKDEDLVFSSSSRILKSAVKDACAAMTGHAPK